MSSATQHSLLNVHLNSTGCRKRVWSEPDDPHEVHRSHHPNSDCNSTAYPPPGSADSESAGDFVPIKRIANERERSRTASVNDAFLMLRSLIPTEPMNRKLSKIETLRLASSYISHLHAVLVTGSNPADQPCLRHQQLAPTMCNLNQCPMSACTGPTVHQQPDRTHRPVCTFCVTEMKQHQRATHERAKDLHSTTSTTP
ncbi:unnamed protein product [Echinostoma caproni]|uniref:BHLH domain-containing protein n=1 Tax=Echinostoma caproni TaxID=27848 RepID=A0A183AGZ6_9TREM|nr:unnamed protein product [Echinostoma caproni]